MAKAKEETKEVALIDVNNYPMLLDPSETQDVIKQSGKL
jgi:hypothetical protein